MTMMFPKVDKPDALEAVALSPEERALLVGDLKALSEPQRANLYRSVCESVGLNYLTRPFEYIVLNGKLVFYARKDCTEQLRKIHGISLTIVARESMEGVYIVTARATTPVGRTDESIGAVPIAGLKGEALANAIMKAETKAKRRITLSICGLGMLDETELETIPVANVQPFVEPSEAALADRAPQPALASAPAVTRAQEVLAKMNRAVAVAEQAPEPEPQAATKDDRTVATLVEEMRDLLDFLALSEEVRVGVLRVTLGRDSLGKPTRSELISIVRHLDAMRVRRELEPSDPDGVPTHDELDAMEARQAALRAEAQSESAPAPEPPPAAPVASESVLKSKRGQIRNLRGKLQWDDGFYRNFIDGMTDGQRSSASLTSDECDLVIRGMEELLADKRAAENGGQDSWVDF